VNDPENLKEDEEKFLLKTKENYINSDEGKLYLLQYLINQSLPSLDEICNLKKDELHNKICGEEIICPGIPSNTRQLLSANGNALVFNGGDASSLLFNTEFYGTELNQVNTYNFSMDTRKSLRSLLGASEEDTLELVVLTRRSVVGSVLFLGDRDYADNYGVEIHVDPTFQTPIVNTIYGVSKCPTEQYTVSNEKYHMDLIMDDYNKRLSSNTSKLNTHSLIYVRGYFFFLSFP
jgi:hypothetical protein